MAGAAFPHLHGDPEPKVGVVFGSASDWPTMKIATEVLGSFGVAHEYGVVSAHRTPDRLRSYATSAVERGLKVVIAGAGGAAHLPGMLAAWTTLPVLGVPVESRKMKGIDSLYSIVQMPGGVPVGTLAIGESGARNAALLAVRILALANPELQERMATFREEQAESSIAAELA